MIKTTFSLFLFLLTSISTADEIRPGYLEIKEQSRNVYSFLWKVPAKGENKLGLKIIFHEDCKIIKKIGEQFFNGAFIQKQIITCVGGLTDKTISIPNLQSTNTDVLLHIEQLENSSITVNLTPKKYSYKVPEKSSPLQIVQTYTLLGIEHILIGVDHLLFVFALLLIVKSKRLLLWTITAFTLAHSITLAGATLGLIHIPQKPVEAIIALSILFLAVEIIHVQRGKMSIAAQWPWLVAFIFGLLHGLGFAGALVEIGLPEHAISLALIFFNIGVELGQIIFIAFVFVTGWVLLHTLKISKTSTWPKLIIVYSIGGISAFWLIERIYTF